MPEKPKKKPEIDKDKSVEHDESLWSEDQKAREYYYDDAHGYERYKPYEDEKEEAD